MARIMDMNIYPMKNDDESGLVAIANLIVYMPLHISGIGVYKTKDGEYRLRYPAKDNKHHYVRPTNPSDSQYIEEAVITKVRRIKMTNNRLTEGENHGNTTHKP